MFLEYPAQASRPLLRPLLRPLTDPQTCLCGPETSLPLRMLLPLMHMVARYRHYIQISPALCSCLSSGPILQSQSAWESSFIRCFASNNPALTRLSRAHQHREKKKVASRGPRVQATKEVEQSVQGTTPSNTKASEVQLSRAFAHQALVITRWEILA